MFSPDEIFRRSKFKKVHSLWRRSRSFGWWEGRLWICLYSVWWTAEEASSWLEDLIWNRKPFYLLNIEIETRMENERFPCRDKVLSRHHTSRRERSPPSRSSSRTLESSFSCNVHACDWFAFDIPSQQVVWVRTISSWLRKLIN